MWLRWSERGAGFWRKSWGAGQKKIRPKSLGSPCGAPGRSDWFVSDVINFLKVLLKMCSAGKQTSLLGQTRQEVRLSTD